MAKWGEGDPRWIVEEHEDAKNVNNWHWAEKNATQWSKDVIKKLLNGLVVENDSYFFEITDVTKIDGEAIANNRKAKVIVFYEWVIEGDWKALLKTGENKTEFKGKFDIPNLSEEYDASELDINVTIESNSNDAAKIKDYARKECAAVIREKLGKYITDLKTEYTKDLILPTKKVSSDAPAATSNVYKQTLNEIVVSKNQVKTYTKFLSLDIEEEFFCTPNDLYQVFLNSDLVTAFSRSPCKINCSVGGEFLMFGETISGFFEEFTCPNLIKLKWRHKSWIPDHYSSVEIHLKATDSGTVLNLKQSNIPENDFSNTKEGWKHHYFHAIKMTFGYGGKMF